mgnify:CR=1 FL=1
MQYFSCISINRVILIPKAEIILSIFGLDFFNIENINKEHLNTSDIIYYQSDIIYTGNIADEIEKDGTYYYPIPIGNDFFNGLKIDEETWNISGTEVHIGEGNPIYVYKIESNDDLTFIATIAGEKRIEESGETTFKKLK